MCKSVCKTFESARWTGTPIVVITTPDPAHTVRNIMPAMPALGSTELPAILRWDCASGLSGASPAGDVAVTAIAGDAASSMTNPAEILIDVAPKMPQGACLIMLAAHRYADNPVFAQALWNLRDPFKATRRTVVLLAPHIEMPAEFGKDAILIDEPLPSAEELSCMLEALHEDAGLPQPDAETLQRALAALSGLAPFPAETAASMSLTRQGLKTDPLWQRKADLINAQKGLSVFEHGPAFEHIAGYENVKAACRNKINGRLRPRCIAFIDEIEKHVAGGNTGDTSGVKQAMHGTLLSWMSDHNVTGNIFLGPPGSGKSAVAKAFGKEGRIPTIAFDLSGMQGGIVGESEQNLRAALKVLEAFGGDNIHFIATCNSISNLSPELRRRLADGTFFFDLPTQEERLAIWRLYLDRFPEIEEALPEGVTVTLPDDTGWTGSEIEVCCRKAWEFGCSLVQAAAYIVPVAVSARESIAALRAQAHGAFTDASYGGPYDKTRHDAVAPEAAGRKITLPDA